MNPLAGYWRVIVTGSRNWTRCDLLYRRLNVIAAAHPRLIIVQGDCPKGADKMARDWQQRMHSAGATALIESIPAVWRPRGELDQRAGFNRNAEMVARGAGQCEAFLAQCVSPRCRTRGLHPSEGATHCSGLAEAAGIPTNRWTADLRLVTGTLQLMPGVEKMAS